MGYVMENKNYINRIVYKKYNDKIKKIYSLYSKNNLKNQGIVKTTFRYKNRILIHPKYTISYPFEWSANMFKDALLFHLNLYLKLDKHELTLKDGILNNILFYKAQPIFVDFFSMIFKRDLSSEIWLLKLNKKNFFDLRFAIFNSMILPFMIEPFILFARKNNITARNFLFSHYVNVVQVNSFTYKINKIFWKKFYKIKFFFFYLNNNLKLLNKSIKIDNKKKFNNFLKKIVNIIKIIDVSPKVSNYSSYYEDKKENYNFLFDPKWGDKQKNVFKIIKTYRPKSVLDLGCNTGWFSFLAAKNGASVIAIDNDESCVDKIYLYTKKNNFNILPLVMSFEDLHKHKYGIPLKKNTKSKILFSSPISRFQSDMVMCLALSHHLILGNGLSIKKIFEDLSLLTKKYLVFEFVDLNDPLIKKHGNFFQNLEKYNKSNYNLDIINQIALKSFKNFKIFNSNTLSRKILLYIK
jgi:2-polyprenyl-3-methyl-5-hydroxy-6-metoxy-1,4-benzoquinol methylase